MAERKDYYEVMGVPKNASDNEIKKVYHKLVKQYHPDLNSRDKTAEVKFKEVSGAYEVLSDQEEKAWYDQLGHTGVDPNFGDGPGASPFDSDIDLGDIFNSFFGGLGVGRNANPDAPRYGRDAQASITISFEEAAKSTKKQVSYRRIESCQSYSSPGAESRTETKTCPQCGGTGQVRISQRTPFGMMQTSRGCSHCGGKGKVIDRPCHTYGSTGRIRKTRMLEVTIPADIDDGQTLDVGGHDSAGTNGGPAGDLHVFVTVCPHPIFERCGNDVRCEVPITFAQAALGAEVVVPTLDGKVSYQIHDDTQPGDVFELRDKGIPNIHGRGRSDQYVRVTIKVPKNLTDRQKEILRGFDGTGNEQRNYQKRKSFFDKIEDLFDIEEKE